MGDEELLSESEVLIYNRHAEYHMLRREVLERAMVIVRDYIAKKSLIVYGGLAIHFFTKSKDGKGIYDASTLPDYDVLSPDNVNMAYEVGTMLHNKDFPDVSVIRAMHVQTMRVRVGPVTVMDLSYAPPKLFETIPTESFEGLRYVSPRYQLIEMHSVFAFPFRGAPLEDVNFRWTKTERRLNAMLELWTDLPSVKTETKQMKIPKVGVAHGFYALALLHDLYNELGNSLKLEFKPTWSPKLLDNAFESPMFHEYVDVVVNDASKEVRDILKDAKVYKPLASFRKKTAIKGGVRMWLLTGDLLAVAKHKDTLVPNVHYTLMFLLSTAAETKDKAVINVCLSLYKDLVAMTAEISKKVPNNTDVILSNPFCVNLKTYGTKNYSEAFEISLERFKREAHGAPPSAGSLPRNIFFSKKSVNITPFDYKSCEFFYDGGPL